MRIFFFFKNKQIELHVLEVQLNLIFGDIFGKSLHGYIHTIFQTHFPN